MTRVTWATLLAFVAWLSAGGESTRALERRQSPSAAVVAIDAPTPPLAPRAHETLSLLRRLALRGEEQRRHSRPRLTAAGNAPALAAARLASPRATGVATDDARRRRSPRYVAEALAFPYDATAPPPAGRRA